MIQKKDELKNLLNKGFESAKQNIRDVLKHISFKGTKKEYYEKNQDILAENQTKFVLNNLDDENIPKNKNEEVLNNNNENIIKGNLKFNSLKN